MYNSDECTLQLGTIAPCDLKMSRSHYLEKRWLWDSRYTDEELLDQQWALEEDIVSVNEQIADINNKVNMPTIRWDRDVTKTTVKRFRDGSVKSRKVKFTYSHFKDGVHPDPFLRQKWFSVLCNTIVRHLPPRFCSDR